MSIKDCNEFNETNENYQNLSDNNIRNLKRDVSHLMSPELSNPSIVAF